MFANARYSHEVFDAIDLCKEILEERQFADVAYTISRFYSRLGRFYDMRRYLVESCYIYPLNEELFEHTIEMLGCSFPSEEDHFNFNESVT